MGYLDRQAMKLLAGRSAVDALVRSGMKLGLGTGSTAIPAVRRIGALMAEGRLQDVKAVPTSFQTVLECEALGIPLFSLNSPAIGGKLDLTIDGADEVDSRNFCTKGGGGALLLEKIIAYASASYAIVADESKIVDNLGITFAIPVEVVPEARVPVMQALKSLGGEPVLREALRKAGPVITEHGNFIVDVRLNQAMDPAALETEFNRIPGIVENGLFTRLRPSVFIARSDGGVERRD
ncbi:MAG: ribose-5-phosphate isomerase RpiA [Spirochaetaceae bacterium]|jgi:ribose 5-phosphate isomerase A|nr:ribose-5-phosphate isomerase RpiA [Spirochaetaceae bacterium]